MRRTLYLKFLVAYLIFGFFGFIIVATFVYNMTEDHFKKETAEPEVMLRIYIRTRLLWMR